MTIFEKISPKVSVIVPLFNGEKYIEACIQSILSQTYQNFEIIIVDDGSTDDSFLKVQNFRKSFPDKVLLFQHPDKKNKGIAHTRNLGIKISSGQIISFIDQDDIWESEKLSNQIAYLLKYPEAKFIYCKAGFLDSSGKQAILDGYDSFGKGIEYKPYNMFSKLLYENFIPSITVMFYRDCLNEVGLFEEGPRHEYEDWILWTKIALLNNFLFIPEVLAYYRVHSKNYSLYRLKSGLDLKAEEHYINCVFKFLLEKSVYDIKIVKKLLTRRIFRFLVRAKSWGTDQDQLKSIGAFFSHTFSFAEKKIKVTLLVLSLINPAFAKLIRRFRRRIIGI